MYPISRSVRSSWKNLSLVARAMSANFARSAKQRTHVTHRTPKGLALVDVAKVAGVLGLLRFEPPRRERQRAQGRHDAREQEILLVAPAGEPNGDPPAVSRQRAGLAGERGRIREFVERIVRHPGEQCVQYRMPQRVSGNRRAHREIEIRPRLAELDIGMVPQIEAGPAREPGRPRLGRRLVDQGQTPGQERIRFREPEGAVRDRIAPACHGSGRNRAQAVRRVMKRRNRIGRHSLCQHGHEHTVRDERGDKPPHEFGVEVVEPPGRGQDLPDRVVVQGGGKRDRMGNGLRLLLKAEPDPRHADKLLVPARLDAPLADEVDVRERRCSDVVAVREPCLGRVDGDAERREVPVPHAETRVQPFRPAARLQRREQAAPAFVSEEVRDERERVRPVVGTRRRNREQEREGADLAHRLDVEPRRQESFRIDLQVDVGEVLERAHGPLRHQWGCPPPSSERHLPECRTRGDDARAVQVLLGVAEVERNGRGPAWSRRKPVERKVFQTKDSTRRSTALVASVFSV